MSLNELTIVKAHQGLQNKDFSSQELTRACLDEIKKTDSDIKAFITVTEDKAMSQAKQVDGKIEKGVSISPLAGIPYAAKDIFCTAGLKTTAGSNILENYIPPYESTTTKRLLDQDAILIGKTNMDEFAMGSSTENSAFFTTRNPHDYTRVPGGSSGGSAAAVAANHCLYTLGTDTGGSIRQPASLCGVVGLKPTYGRTSRYGVMAMASSFDTIGHLTRTVEDSALVLQYIAGHDKIDSTTSKLVIDNYLKELNQDITGLKIGIPKQYFASGLNENVKKTVQAAITKIEELSGTKAVEIDLPHTEYAISCYYIIMPAEVSSNLSRYDGIKYGSKQPGKDLLESYLKTRSTGFGDEVKRRIMLGTYTLSHGYYDAYYKKALSVRTLIKQDFEQAFKKVDILLTPTTPAPAFKIGEKTNDPLQMYLSDIYTVSMNLAGVPALSVPCGHVNNLPVGLQIIGNWFQEKTILKVGHQYEISNL